MSNYTQVSVTLPGKMMEEIARHQKRAHLTRSELFRVALRQYFLDNLPTEKPTPSERRAIKRGLEAVRKGDVYPLEEVLHEMGR